MASCQTAPRFQVLRPPYPLPAFSPDPLATRFPCWGAEFVSCTRHYPRGLGDGTASRPQQGWRARGPGRECGLANGVGVGLEREPTAEGPHWDVDLVRVAAAGLSNLPGPLWPPPLPCSLCGLNQGSPFLSTSQLGASPSLPSSLGAAPGTSSVCLQLCRSLPWVCVPVTPSRAPSCVCSPASVSRCRSPSLHGALGALQSLFPAREL